MSSKTLTRRASDEKRNTYWLEHKGVGFVRVHTCALGTRKVDPELAQLAACVEYAPELLQGLKALYALGALEPQTVDDALTAKAKAHAVRLLNEVHHAHNPEPQP